MSPQGRNTTFSIVTSQSGQHISAYCRHNFVCCHSKHFCDLLCFISFPFRATQFRWIQKEGSGERQSWAVDHVYIGEACPGLCSGHGYCTSGSVCICDEGHHGGPQALQRCFSCPAQRKVASSELHHVPSSSSPGDDCSLSSSDLPSSVKDNFESGSVLPESWQSIQGGGVGNGCGQLSPHAHGDSLYFNGCKMRQAVTKPLDLTRARYRYYQNTQYYRCNS